MRILKDLSCEIEDTNSYHWAFEKFSDENSDILLSVGFNSLSQNLSRQPTHANCKWVLFNNWAPCDFAQNPVIDGLDAVSAEDKFEYVLTICPYTSDWLNRNASKPKHLYAFYPYSEDIIPIDMAKAYDVIYHGGIHGYEHKQALNVMKNFKYAYSSLSYGINRATRNALRDATHIDLSFQEKINLIAKSKISICFNLIHVSFKHLLNFHKYNRKYPQKLNLVSDIPIKGIIPNFPWFGVLPQFKTRVHEAAISKTINLVYKDKWGVVEDYYEPDKEFIYFSSLEELPKKIDYILANWEKAEIQNIVERAYEKSKRYTTQNFVSCYSKVLGTQDPLKALKFNESDFWREF